MLLIVVLVFGTKKLKNIGTDLGGAVKGFKDGVRDGGATAEPPVAASQVNVNKASEANTVDVEAKTKS